jgi:hypothetical protein
LLNDSRSRSLLADMTLIESFQVQKDQLIDKKQHCFCDTTTSSGVKVQISAALLRHHDVGRNPGIQSDIETDMIPIPQRQLLFNPIGCTTTLSTAQRAPGYHASYPSTLSFHPRAPAEPNPSPTRTHTSPTNPDNRCRIHLLPRAAFPPRHPRHGPLDEHHQPLEPF